MIIQILTASPERDKVIDEMIGDELRKKNHEVHVSPCIRGGRQAILQTKPDVVVVPPIKNPFSRDLVEQCKYWGMGVVTRHTEASLDYDDWKAMNQRERAEIMGIFPYQVDAEIVWGPDEAQILSGRRANFPVFSVGSYIADIYKLPDFNERFMNREAFNKKLGLGKKKTILFASCWSFADTAPDLRVDCMFEYDKERDQRDLWIEAIKHVHKEIGHKRNIVVKIHPGEEKADEYVQKLPSDVKVIKEQSSPETLKNVDYLVHAGSTMAIEAHMLGMPAFRFGDVNYKMNDKSWFTRKAPMSMISPIIENHNDLVSVLSKSYRRSNADRKVVTNLEVGRFGKMDGQATSRAAEVISKIKGEFKLRWPRSHRDYSTDIVTKSADAQLHTMQCNVCGQVNYISKKGVKGLLGFTCAHCGCKCYMRSNDGGGNNTG